MRLVLDTDVVVAAMRSPTGASAALSVAAREARATLLLSVPLALEYEAACRRPEHREAADLTASEAEILIDAVIALAEPVTTHFLWRPRLRDPGDEMVLETAINGRAEVLVTFNLRDYGMTPAEFGIRLMRPSEALRKIRS